MSALNRQTSKSTELLHVTSPESTGEGARRSWDSLVAEKRPDAGGLNGDRLDRARFSVCGGGGGGGGGGGVGGGGQRASTPPAATSSGVLSPWFGGGPSLSSGDQSPRILGTMPRNIVALLDRPVTYEEELEDRMGLLKASATTLCQRLAGERKKATELAKQLQARELNHRGTVEKMREQYDLRFERLKSRARLLVRRCEFLRNEKQTAEQRLTQVIESGARERQGMERRMAALEEEIDRLKNEKDERHDIQTPRETEEADEEEDDVVRKEEKEKSRKAPQLNGGYNGLDSENFRIFCEIAVARVSLLEHWVSNLNSDRSTVTKQQQQQQLFGSPPSLTQRTISCPMIAVSSPFSLSDNDSLHSNENQPEEESHTTAPASPASPPPAAAAAAVEPDSPNPRGGDGGGGGGAIDGTVVLRRPGDRRSVPGVPPPRRPIANARSMPPTTGHALPILPSTIRISLQKFFHGGKSNQNEASSVVVAHDARRFETLSDDEFQSDAKSDRRPKRVESAAASRGGAGASPCPAKRHSSLPKNELLKKFQRHGGGHDCRGSSPSRSATLPTIDSAPTTHYKRTHHGPTRVHDHSSADDLRFTGDDDDEDDHRCLRGGGEGGGLAATTSIGRTDRRVDRNSTESLPDKVEEDGKGEETNTAVKRHLSVHSTFDRLHHRRNGLANIERIETKKKTTTSKSRPTSAFDSFGKNLKQYLH